MNEPTVALTYDCETCNGTGRIESATTTGGRTRTFTSGATCRACLNEPGPPGKVETQATLTQLKQLLQEV